MEGIAYQGLLRAERTPRSLALTLAAQSARAAGSLCVRSSLAVGSLERLLVMTDMKLIKVKHAGATHEIGLHPNDCPYEKIAALLNLPKDRIKIIRLGKLLPPRGDHAIQEALVAGGVYMVAGTTQDAQLPSNVRRQARLALEGLSDFFAGITWAVIYAWVIWLWMALTSIPRVAFLFITSMVMPPTRPPSRQEQQRAVRDHAD